MIGTYDLRQWFSNRVSRHIYVSRVFSGVSPKFFETSFWGKIMQICHLNMVFCSRSVSPKIILWKMCRQPKKVENHWSKDKDMERIGDPGLQKISLRHCLMLTSDLFSLSITHWSTSCLPALMLALSREFSFGQNRLSRGLGPSHRSTVNIRRRWWARTCGPIQTSSENPEII